MLVLNIGDKLRGVASTASVIDYTIHGLIGNTLNRFAEGQLTSSESDLYLASDTVVVTSLVLVNTDTVSRTINLYIQPNSGTSRHIVTKDLVLGAGYSLHYDGVKVNIVGPSGGIDALTLLDLTDTPGTYDLNKFLRSTVDGTEWSTVSGGTGSSDHSELSNLYYDTSGHIGFASSEVLSTTSGVLQSEIDAVALIDLSDTPSIYDADKYLRSTVDGTEWATVSGGTGSSVHSELSGLDYGSSGHTGFASSDDLTTTSGVLQTNIDAGEFDAVTTDKIIESIKSHGVISSGTEIFNLNDGSYHTVTVGGSFILAFSNWPGSNKVSYITIKLVNAGAYTVTWPGAVDWPGGVEPGWTVAGIDFAVFFSDDNGTTVYGTRSIEDIK